MCFEVKPFRFTSTKSPGSNLELLAVLSNLCFDLIASLEQNLFALLKAFSSRDFNSVQSILYLLFNKYPIYLYLIVVLNIITEFHLRVTTTSQFLVPNVMVYTINLAGRKIICEFMNFEN